VGVNAHITRIQLAADKLAVALPAAYTAVLAAARQLVEQTERLEGHTGALNNAVIEALLNDDDLADDPQVRKLVMLSVIGRSGIRQSGSDRADAIVAQAIAEHADTIIVAYSCAETAVIAMCPGLIVVG
jgi:hypothetical protein